MPKDSGLNRATDDVTVGERSTDRHLANENDNYILSQWAVELSRPLYLWDKMLTIYYSHAGTAPTKEYYYYYQRAQWMSDDLRLPRRGIEPQPSGFRDIGSTGRYRPSPSPKNGRVDL